jgi:hypothetical protein
MRRFAVRSFIMAAVVTGAHADSAAPAQLSTLETQRADAAALFDRRLDTLNAMRTELTEDWKTYERACLGKVTRGRGSGVVFLRSEFLWFAQSLDIDNETTPACRMLASGIKMRSQHVPRELQQIDEDARRRGIYPGVMRNLKRGYGFE